MPAIGLVRVGCMCPGVKYSFGHCVDWVVCVSSSNFNCCFGCCGCIIIGGGGGMMVGWGMQGGFSWCNGV